MTCLIRELKNIYTCPDYKNEDTATLLSIIFGKGKSTVKSYEMANKLLSKYKCNLKKLSNTGINELSSIIGRNNTKMLLASMEFSRQVSLYQDKDVIINTPEDVAGLLMDEMRYYRKEVFKIVILNTKNMVIKVETISVGTLDSSIIHPREIFYSAIKELASSIIMIHNHPSGVPTPSAQDIDITKKTIEAGKTLNIEILDHIIIGDGKFISMKEKKYME